LQPYRQLSLKKSGIVRRVVLVSDQESWGGIICNLELPKGSRIQNTFHVSYLKNELGQQATTSVDIPPLDEEGELVLAPKTIVDVGRIVGSISQEYFWF
jgi:hypothetical protein